MRMRPSPWPPRKLMARGVAGRLVAGRLACDSRIEIGGLGDGDEIWDCEGRQGRGRRTRASAREGRSTAAGERESPRRTWSRPRRIMFRSRRVVYDTSFDRVCALGLGSIKEEAGSRR